MASAAPKRVAFGEQGRVKCSPSCQRLIYDDPHVFRVRSQRSVPHLYPCESCLKEARRQQQSSTSNNQYPKRCSRLPPRPADLESLNRPKTSPLHRKSNNINWDNFMHKKSKYGKYKNLS